MDRIVCIFVVLLASWATLSVSLPSLRQDESLSVKTELFGKFLDKYGEKYGSVKRDTAFCVVCEATFEMVRSFIADNKTLEEIAEIGFTLCVDLNFEVPDVCRGVMDNMLEEVVYVVGHTDHTAKEFCSFYAGGLNVCEADHFYDSFNWTIEIPGPIPDYVPFQPPQASAPTLTVLHLTDTHHDPKYSEGTVVDCEEPLCCRDKFGPATGNQTAAGKWGAIGYDCEIPLATLVSMLEYAKENFAFDFILWTGDVPPHDVWNQSHAGNALAMDFTSNLIRQYFPDIPIYPSLGNHDCEPVNSYPVPAVYKDGFTMDYLYEQLNISWRGLYPDFNETTILKGGYYTSLVKPGLRIVNINNNYGADQNWWLTIDDDDPTGQMSWLVQVLLAAERNDEKVIVIGHYPPGTLTYTWSKIYNDVVNRFKNVIVAQFYGHTHDEKFQVTYDERAPDSRVPISVSYLGPSVTTAGLNNPGFRVMKFDGVYEGSSFAPLESTIYYLDLPEANQLDYAPWKLLYSAKEEYNLSSMLPSEWDSLLDRMRDDDALLQRYHWNLKRRVESSYCDEECKNNTICDARTSWAGAALLC